MRACVCVCVRVWGYIGGSSPPAEGMISVLRRACMKRPEAIRVSSFVYVGGMVTAHCPQKCNYEIFVKNKPIT